MKCYSDDPLVVPIDGLHIGAKLQIVEEPVEIMDREVKRLKQSRFPIVKVRWNSRRGPEFIWEREDRFQKKYPHLFTNRASSSNATSLSLEDKAHLTGGDYNTPCFRVIDVVNKSAMYLLIMPPRKAPKTRTTPAIETTTTTSVTNAQLKAIEQGVVDALAARDANRNMNGGDIHNLGTGVRRTERVARECTYQDFMKCQPLLENQVKFSTCILLGISLTWWNSHVRTVSHDVAYVMTWTELKKKMTDKYCPRGEMKKLEAELWNLKVKGTDVLDYNKCLQELALLCVRVFPKESDKIERYVGGLPDMIHKSVVASKPKTMQDAIEMATELMDKKISTFVERRAKNKRKLDNNNQAQQQFPKRQNVAQAYTVGTGERKEYVGTLPLCNRCKLHHNWPCTVKYGNYKKVGHMTRDCRNPTAAKNRRTLTCYECGNQGHYRSDCPELKNQNHEN
ncbi:reverse transcriptase domain-containing protein [Tanacetum coccineum]